MKSNKILTAVVVLQGLLLVGQWTNHSVVTPVHAQIPDAGGQRMAMVDELRALGAKVDRLSETLKSGEVQVKVVKADDEKK